MKRIFLVLSLLFVAYFASAQGNEELGISFDKSEHNFGQVVRENKNHACTFVLENKTLEEYLYETETQAVTE